MGKNAGNTPKPTYSDLVKAIESHNIQAVIGLIDAGADVNQPNGAGVTPLIVAVRHVDKFDIIRLLVESGARVTAIDKASRSVTDRIEVPPEPPEHLENEHEAWTYSDEAFVMRYLLEKQRLELGVKGADDHHDASA